MAKDRKESRQFNISVEGINCEKMYFEHLAKLINESGSNKYNAKMNCKKISPGSFAKRNAHLQQEKRGRGSKKIPYLHIQDVEDYYDDNQKKRFYEMLDDMRKAELDFGIQYELGYSNYTFELWMLLHVADMKQTVTNRYAYLKPVNQYFHRNYTTLDQFKSEKEFQGILDEYVTLDSVRLAVKRAEEIVKMNLVEHKKSEVYKGFRFYRENPDVTVHEVVDIIFSVCGVETLK